MMSGVIPNTFKKGLQVNKTSFTLTFLVLLLLSVLPAISQTGSPPYQYLHGAMVRGDTSKAELALVFTGDEYADGGVHIVHILKQQGIKASFFLTGEFYKNAEFEELIHVLVKGGHYLGAHSDQHLLYCDWVKRDSLLVTQKQFSDDLHDNYEAMATFSINEKDAPFFLPPYEWYNDSNSSWTKAMGLQLINHTHGTLSHADYTVPGTRNYHSSDEIYQSILDYETSASNGLNGFILLSHIGTVPERTDKFYFYLEKLLVELKLRAYQFKRIDELLAQPLH